MPNLLVATGIFHPEAGGPATYLREILPAVQKLGWNIRVLSYGDSAVSDYPYTVNRIRRHVYPLRLARYGHAARGHLRWADLVYLQTIDLPLWGSRRAPRVIKIVGDQAWERCIRKAWIPPELTVDEFQTFRAGLRARWQQASRSRQAAATDAVIVPSAYLRRMVIGWGAPAEKVRLIYNALPGVNRPDASRAVIRAELGWADSQTLLTVARLHPWKGIDYLIAAVAELPELRLVVVGDGPDKRRLQALAAPCEDRIRFTGALPQTDVRRLMVAADGLALYSSYEGLSHALLESLQLGTPVLASDRGGNPELVHDAINGVLVPYANGSALRAGINRLLSQRDEYAAGTARGAERFAFSTMVKETDQILRSLLR